MLRTLLFVLRAVAWVVVLYLGIAVILAVPGFVAGSLQTWYYGGVFVTPVLPAEVSAALWLAAPFVLLMAACTGIWLLGRLHWCHCPS